MPTCNIVQQKTANGPPYSLLSHWLHVHIPLLYSFVSPSFRFLSQSIEDIYFTVFFFLLLSLMPKLCGWKNLGCTHIEAEVIFNTERSKTGPQQMSPLMTSKQIKAFHGHTVWWYCATVCQFESTSPLAIFWIMKTECICTWCSLKSPLDFAFFMRMSCIQNSQKGLFHFHLIPKEGTFFHGLTLTLRWISWSALSFTDTGWTFFKFQPKGSTWLIKLL